MPTGVYKRTKKGYWAGKKRPLETIKKISLANKGKKYPNRKTPPAFSKKHRDNMSKSRKGRVVSKETREKISNTEKGKIVSKETRRKLSIANTGRIKTILEIKKISKTLTGIKRSKETKKKMREYRIEHPNKKFKETGIELKIEEELKRKGIKYKKQVSLCKIAVVDFLLTEFNIVIQCDGCYWHKCPIHYPHDPMKRKEKDKKQDGELKSNNFKVYRFWEHEINRSAEECINKIKI